MKLLFVVFCSSVLIGNASLPSVPLPGFEKRINNYIDSIPVVDTHEHMFDPEKLRTTYFLDFTLLLHQNSWDDLVSAGMPDTLYNYLFNKPLSASEKWKYIKPYWEKTFNTSSNRVIMTACRKIYGISGFNDTTVTQLSEKMKEVYGTEWFNYIMKDICRFDFVLQESDSLNKKSDFVRYTGKFTEWLTIRSTNSLDSLALNQAEPIYTLGDLVNSQMKAFEKAVKKGMVAVKINIAYDRTLKIEDVSFEDARKVFRTLVNGNESFKMSSADAKPLQDFMLHRLLQLARHYEIPVAIHTGLQAGRGNYLNNSDPSLLTNLFISYPDIRFVLYHGSYPFGGKLSALAKNFPNVSIDMNWTYSVSPAYAGTYLREWLETVPAAKIMAFGGDQRCVENTFGELMTAKRIISEVLTEKVRKGYITECEALNIAKMILHDNAVRFYNLSKGQEELTGTEKSILPAGSSCQI